MANHPRRPRDPVTGAFRKRDDDPNAALSPLLDDPNAALPPPLDDDAYSTQLSPPKPFPNPRVSRPPPPPSSPGLVREVSDRERLDPGELAMRQRRARHLEAMKHNRFIGVEETDFPSAPDDDSEWAYLWIRHTLPPGGGERQEFDSRNVASKVAGGLRYEFVRLQDLPEEYQARYGVYRGKVDGIDGNSHLVYKDLILGRTDRALRDEKQAKNDYDAFLQREQVQANFDDRGARGGFLTRGHFDDPEERLYAPDEVG